MKAAITAQNVARPAAEKLNKNPKDYAWTGVVVNAARCQKLSYTEPAWA